MGGPGSGAKPRQYPTEIVTLACELYEIGMTVAEIRAVFPKGYRVQTILERHLPTRRSTAKRNQRGPANHMWRGDSAGYAAAHVRLADAYGKARSHSCADCGEQAAHWSFNNDCDSSLTSDRGMAYCLHLDHYEARCIPCHFRFDYKGRRLNGQLASRREVMSDV